MGLFSSKKRDEITRLVCVVTGYSATAAIVRAYDRGGAVAKPIVLFSHTEKISVRKGAEGVLNESAATATKRALDQCRRAYGNLPAGRHGVDELVCAIGEPWAVTLARTVHQEKPAAFAVTKKIIDELVARDRKIFEAEIVNNYDDMGLVQAGQPVVECNGYRIGDYVGKKVARVDVHNAYTIASADILDELTGAFVDVFHRNDVHFVSMDIARGAMVPATMRGTVIDIGGTTTTISIIDRRMPTHHISIPMGLSDFESHIAQLFTVSHNRIDAVMHFASDEKLLQHERDEYYRRMELAYAPMGILIERACAELRRHIGMLPEPAYLIGSPDWISVLGPMLQKSAGVLVLSDETIHNRVVYSHGTTKNIPLTLAILNVLK